jgi:NADH-quinone oxidoreductase subunit L
VIEYAWLVPTLPLLGAIVAAVGGRWLRQQAHLPVIAGIGLSFLVSVPLLGSAGPSAIEHEAARIAIAQTGDARARTPTPEASRDPGRTTVIYHWIDAGDLHVPVILRVDGLTTMMLSMVTFVAMLVAIFAAGYMAGDPGYARFFALVGLFVFSMTGLVLSSNYVLTYAFWEGVGVCSYLLIGFWYAKPSAAAAAKKAFLVNRVGDFGFAIALFWLWTAVPGHDLGYDNILSAATLGGLSDSTKIGIALLLFWAATAKSAQVPLYVWLPDAMEGPTPVSALIHAATMVTAGVYLIARSAPLVMADTELGPVVPLVIAATGCVTALLSAAIAVTQTDLKRVLAYSTVSQLGYMFMALGAGVGGVQRLAVVAAMFHLFTHAFFKALLFLGSGSVMHAMGHVIDMRRFGGLRHRMPITCATFAIGGLALAGIVPLAGFWSKDEILAALSLASHEAARWGWAYAIIYWLAVLTALLTAFYTGRAFFLTFFGPEKLPSPDDPEADPHEAEHGHGHGEDPHFGHESPPVMWGPLVVLAAGAVLVGIVLGPTHLFAHHLERTPGFEQLGHAEHGTDWLSIGVGTLVGLLGLVASWYLYADRGPIPARLASRLRPLYLASLNKFWVDEIYQAIIVAPTWVLARLSRFIDVYIVDGLVRLAAWIPRFVGRELLSPFQNGLVQFYASATALGLAALLVYLLFF